VNIGVGRESRSGISSGTVMFVTDVIGIADETLLVCDVAHDRGWVVGMRVEGDERWKKERKRGVGVPTAHPTQVL